MRRSGGGLTVAEPKLGTNYSEMPPSPPVDESTTDDGDTPTDGSGDGGVDRTEVGTDAVLPPPVVLDDSDDGDESDGNDEDGGDDGAGRISQRLTRGNRGVRISAQGSGDAVPGAPVSKPVNMPPDWPPVPTPRGPAPASPKPPDTPAPGNASAAAMACHRLGIDPALATGKGDKFIVYLGSGRDRPGSVREHAAKSHLTVVMIDN